MGHSYKGSGGVLSVQAPPPNPFLTYDGAVTLNWVSSGLGQTAWDIERSTGGAFSLIDQIGPTERSYVIVAVEGQLWRVRGTDHEGNPILPGANVVTIVPS